MKFDVVIGNPPYQGLTKDVAINGGAKAVYPEFVKLACELSNKYTIMITPHRWAEPPRLKGHKDYMLNLSGLKYIKKFTVKECPFKTMAIIKGGVSYFLCEKDYKGSVEFNRHGLIANIDTSTAGLPRFNGKLLDSILNKVKSNNTFSTLYKRTSKLTSNDKRYRNTNNGNDIPILASRGRIVYIDQQYADDCRGLNDWKVVIPLAFTANIINSKSQVVGPHTACNESMPLFTCTSELEAVNLKSYFGTTTVRFLLALIQPSFKMQSPTFRLVPQVDLSQPWDDARTMQEFNLTQEEIDWMQSCIKDFDIHKNG